MRANRRRLERWPGRLAAVLLLALLGDASATGGQLAVLPLTVNQVAKGEGTVLLEDGDAVARVSDLEAAGIRGFGGVRSEVMGELFVSLASLAPQVTWRLDEASLSLEVTVAPELLGHTEWSFDDRRDPRLVDRADPGIYLNYSVSSDDRGKLSGVSELGWTVGKALIYSSLSRTTEGRWVRGLSNVTVDDRRRMIRWVVGDTFAGGGSLAGGTFLAGLTVERNFALDPYFVRLPGLGVSGTVLTPTRAEVWVNGRLVREEVLPPGSFDYSRLPVASGLGETRVVLRDAFGSERVISSPYYLSDQLLARGLSEYSYSLGVQRAEVGTESARYGELVFLGRHRLGLTDHLTGGVRAELSRDLASGGLSVTTSFPNGEVSVDLAGSGGGGERGFAGSLGFSLVVSRLSRGGFFRRTGDRYATVSLPAELDRTSAELGAFASTSFGRFGDLQLQYSSQRWRDAGRAHRLQATLSGRVLGGITYYLSAGRGRTLTGLVGTELSARLGLSLARRNGVSATWQHDDSGSRLAASVQRSQSRGVGFGYRLQGTRDDGQVAGDGRIEYDGRFGIYQASYAESAGEGSGYAVVSGGLVAIGGSVFATRPVQNSFAVIRVPGVPGVRGFASNQEVGRTNSRGDLLVPDLLPYYGNNLSIADADLPADYQVDATEMLIAPPFRGGAVVAFPVHRVRAFLGTLRIDYADASLVPAYGVFEVGPLGGGFRSDVGGRGDFYLDNVPPGTYPARIRYLGTTCSFDLTLPSADESLTRLGPVVCHSPVTAPKSATASRVPTAAPQAGANGRIPPADGPAEPLPRVSARLVGTAVDQDAARSSAHRGAVAGAGTTPPEGARSPGRAPAPAELSGARPVAVFVTSDWSGKSGVFAVHFSSFRERFKAERHAALLAARLGLPCRAVEAQLGDQGTWYRTMIGEFADVEEARRLRAALPPDLAGEASAIYWMEGTPKGGS